MDNNLQNSGMLKGGLVLSLVIQLIVSLICLAFAAGVSSISFIDSVATIPLWIVFGISLGAVLLTSASIHNVNNARVSRAKYSKGLAIFAGIIALFTTLLGGILVLVGAMSTKQSNDRRSNRYDDVLFGRPSREEYRKRRSSRSDRFPS